MDNGVEVLLIKRVKQKIPPRKFFLQVAKKTLKTLKEKRKVTVAFISISSRESQYLNQYWRKKSEAALVLSFPLKKSSFPSPSSRRLLGDVFFCPEMIKKRAPYFQLSPRDFYQRLIVHSLLHLYGYTHQGKEDTKKMERLERKIINN